MIIRTYYVRVAMENAEAFQRHLDMCSAIWDHISYDNGSSLYYVKMDSESALSLKLSFPLLGCLDFDKIVGKLAGRGGS